MMKKKTKSARILAAILTAAMIVTSAPCTALAAEQETGVVTLQNPAEQSGENGQAGDVSDGSHSNPGAGDVSDGSHKDPGNGDVSGSDGNGETGDVSGGSGRDVSCSDSREAVSGNDAVVYAAETDSTGTLTVEGSEESYSYDAATDIVTVKDGAELVFHSAEGYGAENPSVTRIFVEKDANATLTLDGVYIDISEAADKGAPILIPENSTGNVNIVLKGANALIASSSYAGIQKNGDAKGIGTLTISGDGSLMAQGGQYAAGIGGGALGAGSNIMISGGTVTATGGDGGAGIGGGFGEAGSNIMISGGTVTATGGDGGAGIGSGSGSSTATVSITGGSVKTMNGVLTGVTNGTDKVYYTEVDLSEEYGAEAAVTKVSETAYGMKDVRTDKEGKIYIYLPEDQDETTMVFGANFYSGHISSGTGADNRLTKKAECTYDLLVIGAPAYYERSESTYGIQVKDGANLTLKSGKGFGKDNYSRTRIFIEENASVTLTLDGVYIDARKVSYGSAPILIPENSTGNVNIVLKGENALIASSDYAGIQKNGDAEGIGTLTISGDGSLTVQGGDYGAGIGGGYYRAGSDITISGGTVMAKGGHWGAGIGGGDYKAGSDITISGGTVTATGGYKGAGIGGGDEGTGSDITISGGTVTATGGENGAGIGGGYKKIGTGITITGGNVKASSVNSAADGDGKAVYPVRVDLLLFLGKNAPVKEASVETFHTLTGETQSIAYNLKDVSTMEDSYLYLYLPVNEEDTVTRFGLGNAGFEGVIRETAYNGEEYNELILKTDPDGKGDYGDVLREEVPEDGIIPDGIWMTGISEEGYTYTGKAITPVFKVYDGRKLLTVKKDYTVSYKNNINAASGEDGKKAPTITVKSTGNYKGTETCTFTILPASLKETNPQIKAEDLYLAAPAGKNPRGIKAVPVVTDNGKKLTENKDYTLTHVTLNARNAGNNNQNSYVNAGSYVLEITGKGNYTGSREITVTLTDTAKEQILMSKVTVAKIPDVTYDADRCEGEEKEGMTPALTVTYGSGKNKVTLYKEGDINADGETVSWEDADYTVEWINNKQVGTATAILTGTGWFKEDGTDTRTYFGERRITFKIKGQTLSANMVSWADGSKNVSFIYNGEAQQPGVSVKQQKKVKNADGKTVTETVVLREYDVESGEGDYTVSYLKNVDAGTATVVVTGVNGYTGTVKKTFKITQADLAATDTETKITAGDADGTIRASFAKNGAKPVVVVTAKLADGKTVTLTEGKDYTVSYANNKAVSEGKNLAEKKLPLITIKGKGNYKGSFKQTFTITGKSLADTEAPITVTAADVAANKNKGKFVSKPVVTDADGVKLKEKTDYTLTYSLLTGEGAVELDTKTGIVNEPGSVIRITVTGAGNYAGEGSVRTIDYRITELDFNKVTVKVVPKTLPYTTKPVTLTGDDLILTMKVGSGKQAVVETLPLITDGDSTKDGYQIVGYQNNVNKGTAQVTLKGCGKYGGTKTVKFYIGTRPFLWWLRNV